MSEKIKPCNDRILVKIKKIEEKRESGLIVPTAKNPDDYNKAFFVQAGPNCQGEYNENDLIIFPKQAGTRLEWNNESYLLLREDDILAIIES